MKNKVFYLFILFFFSSGVVNAQGPGVDIVPADHSVHIGGYCTASNQCISPGSCFISGDPANGGFGTCVSGLGGDTVGLESLCSFATTYPDYTPLPEDSTPIDFASNCSNSSAGMTSGGDQDDSAQLWMFGRKLHVPIVGCSLDTDNDFGSCEMKCNGARIPRGLVDKAYSDAEPQPGSQPFPQPSPQSACEVPTKFCTDEGITYNPTNTILCPGNNTGLTNSTPSQLVSVLVPSCPTPVWNRSPRCQKVCKTGYIMDTPSGEIPRCVLSQNVFGWAWSSNIGWIKMSGCEDSDNDGAADDSGNCYAGTYGVHINNNVSSPTSPRKLSGYAWNNNIGWINFGDSGLGSPPAGGATGAYLTIPTSTATFGTFSGWARFLSGIQGGLFDGWLSLAGANYPSGSSYLDGSRGLTYNKSTARIVGSIWGGRVIGWIKFGDGVADYPKVTYGAPTPNFDYSIEAKKPSPDFYIFEEDEFSQQVATSKIILTKNGFVVPPVINLSAVWFIGGDKSVPPTFSLNSSNCAVPLPCKKDLNITINPNTTPGAYSIKITATPVGITPPSDKIKTVNVGFFVPGNTPIDQNFEASCYPVTTTPPTPFYVSKPVTWELKITTATFGHSTFIATLKGDNIPSAGLSMSTSDSPLALSAIFIATKTYSTTGIKHANVSVAYTIPGIEKNDLPIPTINTLDCLPNATVFVDPNIREF